MSEITMLSKLIAQGNTLTFTCVDGSMLILNVRCLDDSECTFECSRAQGSSALIVQAWNDLGVR